MPDSPPRLIGNRYQLADEIGRGGMGVVWRARDKVLDRPVALKQVLLPDWVSGRERDRAFERVLREARSAARLRHPGVITIHDVVLDEGYPWIVMELLPAESLHEVVERWGPLTEEVAVELGVKLLDALQAAHDAGITHRDVKPGNVLLLDGGDVVLTDFGVAHVADSPTITGTGMLLGSPAFMAPERLEGRQATAASDLWALGATLYTAVEGAPPYRGPTPVAVLAAILMSEPRPPRLAGRLRPVIEGLMARDLQQRLSHAAARAALIRAGGRSARPGSRALADLVRRADEAAERPTGPSQDDAPGLFPVLGPGEGRERVTVPEPEAPNPAKDSGADVSGSSAAAHRGKAGAAANHRENAGKAGVAAAGKAGVTAAGGVWRPLARTAAATTVVGLLAAGSAALDALPYLGLILAVCAVAAATVTWRKSARWVAAALLGGAAGFTLAALSADGPGAAGLFAAGWALTVPWLIWTARRGRSRARSG